MFIYFQSMNSLNSMEKQPSKIPEQQASHKKEQNNTICNNMDTTRDYHTK